MKNYKNYLIALLAGLLVLTLSTQPSQGAGSSKEAKIVEYDNCIRLQSAARPAEPWAYYSSILRDCAKYKP
jgi:hypothetical protein